MSHALPAAAVTLSVRVTPKAKNQLDDLAEATGRTKSYLASEAIEQYLENQSWQIAAIEKSLKKAKDKTKFIDHDTVTDWLNSWGDDQERKPPKCK
ncbi:MAG TPA: CopG family ribbon-helix-helix protein [Gammaproteobacteria bacterium]|nr:CopG family ribbon-helix-helix protein [Gammaproteobacteria bacterium]